jgi:hypothetical protein
LTLALLLNLAANGYLLVGLVAPHARSFPVGLRECYLGMGQWLRANSAEESVVAALDIGALAYASERRILDLMGLVTPETLELGQRLGFAEMIESGAWLGIAAGGDGRPPEYLVDRTADGPRWEDAHLRGVRFELLRSCVIEGLGLGGPQPWTVTLYRLVRSADADL